MKLSYWNQKFAAWQKSGVNYILYEEEKAWSVSGEAAGGKNSQCVVCAPRNSAYSALF